MKSKFAFSLRTFFGLTTLAAVCFYLIPITNEVTCDFFNSTYDLDVSPDDRIDIQARNTNKSFKTIISNVKLVSIEPSNDLRVGRWKIEFKSSLLNRMRLSNYEIVRCRLSEE